MAVAPMYRSPYGGTIADLLSRQGDAQAQAALRKGRLGGGVAQDVGQIGAQAYQQRSEQKTQEKREAILDDALTTFDPANPGASYRKLAVALGSERATRAMGTMVSLYKMQQGEQPDPKMVVSGLAALEEQAPGYLEKNWATAGPALAPVASVLKLQLDPTKPPEGFGQQLLAINSAWNPQRATPAAPPFQEVNGQGFERGPQGWAPAPGLPTETPKPTKETRREALDTTTGKPVFVTDAQVDAEPGRYQPMRSGVNVNLQAPGGGKADPLKTVDEKWRTVIDRASLMMPGVRRPAFEAAIGRIAATGNMDELASVIRQTAVEGENVDVKNQVVGRMATIASLEDARSILKELKAKGVPTGWLSGNAEDLARRLGKTTNPEYVFLGNRLAGTLINYRRAATGVQFGDKEQAQYEKMFPNYRQELPVNLALIDGLMREMKTYDKVYWEAKLGKEGAKLVGALKDEEPAQGNVPLPPEDKSLLDRLFGGGSK